MPLPFWPSSVPTKTGIPGPIASLKSRLTIFALVFPHFSYINAYNDTLSFENVCYPFSIATCPLQFVFQIFHDAAFHSMFYYVISN